MEYGLLGRTLAHSFSKTYFTDKFAVLGMPYTYALYEVETAANIPAWLAQNPQLQGFNITIPYKVEILKHAAQIDLSAQKAGAANVMARQPNGTWTAYNTDMLGFCQCLEQQCLALGRPLPASAWVFGNGGASQAVQAALGQLGITYKVASRHAGADQQGQPYLSYQALENLPPAELWVNTTPVGQFPHVKEALPLPYAHLGPNHLAIDLVYNPPHTQFMEMCQKQGCQVQNGLAMLHAQAEAAWAIWQQSL
jgi:shikimate dehydrogenase